MMESAAMRAFLRQNLKARFDLQAKEAEKETALRNDKFYRSSAPLVSIKKRIDFVANRLTNFRFYIRKLPEHRVNC